MTRRSLFLAAALLVAILIALLLRDVVERTIITPLAYLWWVIRLYYSAFPQYILWIVLILISIFSAASSLMLDVPADHGPKPDRTVVRGQIAGLADWITKSRRGGMYYKWLIANRLGKDAREILAQRDGQAINKKFGRLNGRDWAPPREMDSYLESGLNGSFADYPGPRLWARAQPTPLDLDPGQVMDYLENEMETSHERDRKGF